MQAHVQMEVYTCIMRHQIILVVSIFSLKLVCNAVPCIRFYAVFSVKMQMYLECKYVCILWIIQFSKTNRKRAVKTTHLSSVQRENEPEECA